MDDSRIVTSIDALANEVKCLRHAIEAMIENGHNSTGRGGLSDKQVEKGSIPLCPTNSSMYQLCNGCQTPLSEGSKCRICSNPYEYIWDGFGGVWDRNCIECHKPTMQVVRPGKAQCGTCG